MALATKIRVFQYQPFSRKQRQILNWWTKGSPVRQKNGIIADGAIRSGKTLCMSLSFVIWAMENYNDQNFGMCGKTIGSFRRNVLAVLAKTLPGRGYSFEDRRGDNLLIVHRGATTNRFYIFGGKDEGSQDLVQGITLAGVFFDEVALMPQSFVNQAMARCSVEGSKFWFNCNPEGPSHWFYQNMIKRADAMRIIYLHFTMDDNMSLSEEMKERYKSQYSGVFYERYIMGRWVIAEGAIYDMFDAKKHVKTIREIAPKLTSKAYVSVDYGTQNATVFLLWVKGRDQKWYLLREYYYSGRDEKKQKTDAEYVDDMGAFLDGLEPKAVIVDPSAASFITALKKADYPVIKAKNDVLNGIRAVSVNLNKERFYVAEGCKNTVREFGSYVWDDKRTEAGVDTPMKIDDHCMDALRYFVFTIMGAKRGIVRDKDSKGFI